MTDDRSRIECNADGFCVQLAVFGDPQDRADHAPPDFLGAVYLGPAEARRLALILDALADHTELGSQPGRSLDWSDTYVVPDD